MADSHQHPVFFECGVLQGRQLRRIENYFRVRRKSGGGECGPLRTVKGTVYCVAFKHQRDQQNVLRRSRHVVDDLVLTVRGSLDPPTPTPTPTSTSTGSQVFTPQVQPQQSIPASTPPPSGEKYERPLDSYLIQYLKECPKAEKELQERLASVASSAQSFPDEKRVLVRSLAQLGSADEVGQWKAKVDQLFDGYLCHYEVDPHKIKALLQSCSSSPQSTDEVKVYSEVGVAVVVGERSQVNAKLKDVEDSRVKREKQTRIRRLGEAKLCLLWREIKHSLGRDFPGVKVTQGDAGQIVLEGSVEEILKAGEFITGLENLVLERSVSYMSPHLLAFLKKAYGCPAVLGDFLRVGGKVQVELRDRELRLFALCADTLDEIEKALQREIKEVKIDVPNCSAVPPELQEQLKSKTNEMNQGQYRAQVLFGSDGTVTLLGHMNEVEELVTFLDYFFEDCVTIDPLGAVEYVRGPTGKDELLNVEQNLASLSLNEANTTVASYSLHDGLQVLVCQGDITKLDVDALVNAANEDLDHGGGVAAALSKAGGPQVQKESHALVKQTGKIPTGEVVVTTGGNLNCKKLLHAVGPVGGKSGGRERALLEKTVQSALDLAEMFELESIAMPCISSGLFGVPVAVCSEAIVTAIKKFGSQAGRSLSRIILIDNRGEVVRAMQEACDRLLQGMNTRNSSPSDSGFQMDIDAQDTARGATAGAPGDGVRLEVIQGTIETQQVDGLVSPMVGHDPLSTRVGNILSGIVGPQLAIKFHSEAGGATLPGDTVLVEGLPGLRSNAVFFLNLVPWDGNRDGNAVQVLRQGVRRILAYCENRGFRSVALPVLGTGTVLCFPHRVVSKALLEEVHVFEQKRANRTSFLVRIIIHPSDKESSKAFQSAQDSLHLRGFTNDANPDQASFYRHVSLSDDEVTAMLGGVKLQMVHGDIIHERTDAIINTTDFSNINRQSGVSKAILTAAGATVQAELARVGIPADYMCTTGPGMLACREIIHASFRCDPQLIRKNCKKILKQCESKGYRSVAFPAINTGVGGMDFVRACKAMLDGMTSAITDVKPTSVSLIRIVILQQPIFQAFRSELENRFGQTATRHLSIREKAKQILKKWQEKHSRTSSTSAPQDTTFLSFKPLPAVINVIACSRDTIRTVGRDLEGILQKQLVEREVDVHHFSRLGAMEMEAVQAKVRELKISLEYKRRQGPDGVSGNRAGNTAGDRSASGADVYVLKGLKEDVLSVIELVNRAVQEALCEDMQRKEEAMLALSVQWSIQKVNGDWQELSLRDNFLLEEAHLKKQVSVDMMAPDGMMVKVNLMAEEATDWLTGLKYKVKRSDTETTLEIPTHWDPMHEEIFKKVQLQPNSSEYQRVAQGFLRTANYTIQKIERVQNLYLWHAYVVCRQRILAKNGQADLGEKFLYHGTSAESCTLIERDRFDRSYAGKHAAAYGRGVYFAVNANYSAGRYSPPDAAGLKRLYVARVLTGRYTVGNQATISPPPRASDPTDCFDSVVNNQQQPSMFVIFHDDQAYPEYLITFR